nr:hypothetical protein [Bacteroidota bacterium]
MKSSAKLVSCFIGIIIMFSGCNSGYENRYKDIVAGYKEYKDCLKECSNNEAQYKAEYIACFNSYYTEFINSTDCNQYSSNITIYKQCVAREKLEFKLNVDACLSKYENHLKEIEACRASCLAKFNSRFSVSQ